MVGSMNIIKAIRGALRPQRPPLINTPRLHGYGGGGARAKTATFLREKSETPLESRDCESLRMMLSVLGRVPAPVVGVNDAFLRL